MLNYIYAYIDPMGLVQFSTPLKTNMPPKDADFQKESQIPFSRAGSTTLCFFRPEELSMTASAPSRVTKPMISYFLYYEDDKQII